MTQRRILVIDSSHVEAWHARGGHLTFEARHANTDEGHADFERYLKSHARSRFYLLTDVVEEGFQFEAVPAVSGADRKALIARRLAQYFYGSPLATAIPLGRETTGRRDERLLFAALTRPASFEPWLTRLRSAEAKVAGLWSTPLLAPALLAAIAPDLKRALLVTLGPGGIRQTYVEGGRLRFSRLVPQVGAEIDDIASACEAESAKIFYYLTGQRILPRGNVLPVLVVVHPERREIFERHLHSSEDLEFVVADIQRAAAAVGQRDPQSDSFAASLYAHVLLRQPPAQQFAPPDEQRFDQLGRARIGLLAVGALVLAGCLTFAARQMLDTLTLRNQTDMTTAQAHADLGRYNNLLAALPPMPASAADLRALIGRYREIESTSASPFALLADISRALDAMPQVELERIDWSLEDSPDVNPGSSPRHGPVTGPINAEAAYAVVTLSGRLEIGTASQRAQIEAVGALVDELRANPLLKVTELRMPVDIASQRALRSDSATTTQAPRFALRVARKLG